MMEDLYERHEQSVLSAVTGSRDESDGYRCECPQVWPLTKIFFLFPFYENSLTPHRGNTILFRSSQQLPRLRLGPLKDFLS